MICSSWKEYLCKGCKVCGDMEIIVSAFSRHKPTKCYLEQEKERKSEEGSLSKLLHDALKYKQGVERFSTLSAWH